MKSVRNNPSKRHADKDGFWVQLQDFLGKLSRSQLSHTMGNLLGFSWFWINYPALFPAIPSDFHTPIQYFAKEMTANFAEIRRNSRISTRNCELSFQTKIRRNFCASIVLVPAKFRKLGDEPKRKFASWTEILLPNFDNSSRNFHSLTKFRFLLNNILVGRTEILCYRDEILLLKSC